jgi:hypothetical protein
LLEDICAFVLDSLQIDGETMSAQHCINSFSDNDKITTMSMSIYEAIIALQRGAAAYASTATIPENPALMRNPIRIRMSIRVHQRVREDGIKVQK